MAVVWIRHIDKPGEEGSVGGIGGLSKTLDCIKLRGGRRNYFRQWGWLFDMRHATMQDV